MSKGLQFQCYTHAQTQGRKGRLSSIAKFFPIAKALVWVLFLSVPLSVSVCSSFVRYTYRYCYASLTAVKRAMKLAVVKRACLTLPSSKPIPFEGVKA